MLEEELRCTASDSGGKKMQSMPIVRLWEQIIMSLSAVFDLEVPDN